MKSISQQAVAKLINMESQPNEISQPVAAELGAAIFLESIISRITWSHHMILKDKVPNIGQRFWYMLHTLEHGISRNVLSIQIERVVYLTVR
ncbi:MAG TPA: DUF1016 N-terminal domain-containing protein [Segetibacter sp.]